MYKVGEEYLERLREWDASVVDLLGMQQSSHMYALRTFSYLGLGKNYLQTCWLNVSSLYMDIANMF